MTEIVIAILASSGLWGVIQYLISRRDKTAETITKPQPLKLRGEPNEFFSRNPQSKTKKLKTIIKLLETT